MSPDSMTTGWYYSKRGIPNQQGPFGWQQLYSLAQTAQLDPEDLVWNPQLPDWLPAAQIPGLFAAAPAPAPPMGAAAALPLPPQPAAAPPAYQPARRTSVLVWLIPMIAVIIVGAGLGSYLGFFYHRDSGPASNTTASSTASGKTTSTTVKDTSIMGKADTKLPDLSRLVDTVKWGEVPVNQIAVTLADGKTRKDADALAQILGGTVVGEIAFINTYQIETAGASEADLQAALDKAAAMPGVENAFPNMETSHDTEIWGVRQTPLSDPAYAGGRGKGMELIGAQQAWNYIKGSGLPLYDVNVGVVDSGIYKGTGEFGGSVNISFPDPDAGELKAPDKDTHNSKTVDDPTGSHGTMVSGIIGADPDNGGMTGVASVLGHKLTISMINDDAGQYGHPPDPTPDPNDPTQVVLSDGKSYTVGSLVAITKQVENGAKIINCSFGSVKPGPQNATVAAAYTKFFNKMAAEHPDVTFVVAAGNENGPLTKTNYFPAGAGSGLPNVITVGNVMNDGTKAGSSNVAGTDGEVTLAAPGEEVVQAVDAQGNPVTDQTDIGNGHGYGGGTSAATPQVSAAAALLLSLNPDLTAGEIKDILSRTARPGPAGLGGKTLAVDQAVLEVINQQREKQGLDALTPEDMDKNGAVDAVATTTDDPDVYAVRGILAWVADGGTDVVISGSAGVTVEDGEATQSISAAGDVQWPTVRVAVSDSKNPPTIIVTREDTGAASIITLQTVDLNGHWEGTFTLTDLNVDQATATTAENDQGCNLALLAAIFEKLKGVAIPMTMDITADMQAGSGSAVMVIDMASMQDKLNEGNGEGEKLTVTNEPQTLQFTVSGQTITFQPDSASGATANMTGTVTPQGDTAVITGTLTSAGPGFSMTAAWTVTKTQ